MSSDRLRQIIMGLGVLIFFWGVVEIVRGGFDEAEGDFSLPALAIQDVDSIVFERAADTVTLVKQGDSAWTVNGWRAGYTLISDFFAALEEQPGGQLIAQSEGTHDRLEIEDGRARHMRVFGHGDVLSHLLVGKRGRSFGTTYLRLPGEGNVYLVRTRLPNLVDRQVSQWRDRAIAAVNPDSVASAEVTIGRSNYILERSDAGWRFRGGDPADSAAVAGWLDRYRALNALGFPRPEQVDSIDLDPPDRRVTLRDAAQAVLVDLEFDSTASAYWVRRTGDSTVWELSTSLGERLTPADSTLRGQ